MNTKNRLYLFLAAFLVIALVIFFSYRKANEPTTVDTTNAPSADKATPHKGKIERFKRPSTNQAKQGKKKPSIETSDKFSGSNLLPAQSCSEDKLDEMGNMIYQRIDKECDGRIDMCVHYSYDKDGNKILTEEDPNCDGIITRCNRMKYDQFGSMISWEGDLGCDGKVERGPICNEYEYDNTGQVTLRKIDFDCDKKSS